MSRLRLSRFAFAWGLGLAVMARADAPAVDFSAYRADCGASVASRGEILELAWPFENGESGRIAFRLKAGSPLIEAMGISERPDGAIAAIVRDADPALFLTVGSRAQAPNRPPGMSVFNEFFDNPARRPFADHAARFTPGAPRVASRARGVTIAFPGLEVGPFRGEWRFTVYPGARLVKVEAAVTTEEDRLAILYDAGLVWEQGPTDLSFLDPEGKFRSEPLDGLIKAHAIAVRHRAAAASGEAGSVVVSPPPHAFFFPRDFTDNVHTIWAGGGYRGSRGIGLGIRQDATGGGNYVPWFNAPPKVENRLAMFWMLTRAKTSPALAYMRDFTRDDAFAEIPGHITYTSHYHMAIAAAAMKARPEDRNATPAFVKMFKDMNVNAVHLGEFHGDGHQYDPGPLRLPELKAMFAECKRLSDDDLLMIPGEEVAKFLGKPAPGRESGHWMSLFPKPVYWILDRKPGQPFVEDDPAYGRVYRVGDAEDALNVLKAENGLAWTAHPRIKSSSWAPDAFLDAPFFRDPHWLGAAWKAMPADPSKERLGTRGLDLLDDMLNRGDRKFLPGEVDVFTLDPSHELYGHMNVNYLKVDRLPLFDEGWASILDALRNGRFFTTTGEILIRNFRVQGVESGGRARVTNPEPAKVRWLIEGTYPLEFAEVVSGDGSRVFRSRIPLDGTGAFAKVGGTESLDLRGRRWVRFEAWDVAGNGAYTQAVWIDEK